MTTLRLRRAIGLSLAALFLGAAGARSDDARWVNIGPDTPRRAMAVSAVAFADGGAILVADTLGIFRTTDDGKTWLPSLQVTGPGVVTNAYLAGLFVSSASGSPGVLFAGFAGAGIYRSTDEGRNWTQVLLGGGFLSLAVASSSPSIVYSTVNLPGTQEPRTYKSVDGGVTWADLPGLDSAQVVSLAVDPTTSDVVYGAIGNPSPGFSGVLRTSDGGTTWTALGGGLPNMLFGAVAIDPRSPSTVYAGSSGAGVFRSADGGATWSAASDGLTNLDVRSLLVDPSSPSTIYAGTSGGVFRSLDRGDRWMAVGFRQERITTLALDPASPSTLYAGMVGALARITFAPPVPCVAGAETLCLNGGRFRVQTSWSSSSGGTAGPGRAVAITGDTGYFWFFDAANVELVVKVLDGTAINDAYWVFYGALSDVGYVITVTDTSTGAIQSYLNVESTLASQADTSAFPAPASAAAAPPAGAAEAPLAPSASAACTPDANTLCLLGARYRVRVGFQATPEGPTSQATAVPLTGDTGYFWFFDAANVELVVKVLDGTAVNGHVWVFYGALSDVQYEISVTDTRTGAVRTYDNPAGQLASVADTAAF